MCNSMWMEFRNFNLTNGYWVEGPDVFLLFLSFLITNFTFSFVTYVFVEAPMANLLTQFVINKQKKEKSEFFMSQSAKAHLRDKS